MQMRTTLRTSMALAAGIVALAMVPMIATAKNINIDDTQKGCASFGLWSGSTSSVTIAVTGTTGTTDTVKTSADSPMVRDEPMLSIEIDQTFTIVNDPKTVAGPDGTTLSSTLAIDLNLAYLAIAEENGGALAGRYISDSTAMGVGTVVDTIQADQSGAVASFNPARGDYSMAARSAV